MTAIERIKAIQSILGLTEDGDIGRVTRAAFDALDEEGNQELIGGRREPFGIIHHSQASSFADPADVRRFRACKATGKTDQQCFAVGDNGIGQFGKITAQEFEPMVAIHGQLMTAKWGNIAGAAHKQVEVTVNGVTIIATCEDRISAPGRIDLNPAACKLLHLTIPVDPEQTQATWKWRL